MAKLCEALVEVHLEALGGDLRALAFKAQTKCL